MSGPSAASRQPLAAGWKAELRSIAESPSIAYEDLELLQAGVILLIEESARTAEALRAVVNRDRGFEQKARLALNAAWGVR